MNRKLAIPLLLFLLASVASIAQEQIQRKQFAETDQTTYRFYIEEKWDSLIDAGKAGCKDGLDYYYLHARMGRAYFETGRYRKAVHSFRQALKHNRADAFSQEYLYYALIYSGQNTAADAVAGKMAPPTQKQLTIKSLPFSLNLEAGPLRSDGRQNAEKAEMPENGYYAETRLPANGLYIHAGAGFRLARGAAMYAGFSQTTLDYHHRAFLADTTLFRKQLPFAAAELFLQGAWSPGTRWEIIPAVKLARNSLTRGITSYSPQTGRYGFTTDTSRYNDWLGSLTVVYNPGLVSVGLNVSLFEVFDSLAMQTGVGISIYPHGNFNLYFKSGLIYNRLSGDGNLAASVDVGGKIIKNLWAEAGLMAGNLRNMALNGGLVVYNTGYEVNARAKLMLLLQISPHISISATGHFLACRDQLNVLQLPNLWESQNVSFTKLTLTGGIKWTL